MKQGLREAKNVSRNSWTVYCMDGATFSVAVPEDTRVAEMKRAIGALHEVAHFLFENFVEGEEEPLDDEKRLMSAEKVPLFMLPKAAPDSQALEGLFWSCGGAGWQMKCDWMTDEGRGPQRVEGSDGRRGGPGDRARAELEQPGRPSPE
jgi:hypothetical protein